MSPGAPIVDPAKEVHGQNPAGLQTEYPTEKEVFIRLQTISTIIARLCKTI